jgi:phosphoglycerate dehydrogenase-like enzyme
MKHFILVTLPLKDRHIEKIRRAFPEYGIQCTSGDHSVGDFHGSCTVYLGLPTKTELRRLTNLTLIQSGYAGIDALPSEALSDPGLVIASAKGIHNTQMSELFFAMVLYCGRNMSTWTTQKRRREWNKEPVKDSFLLGGKTLCVVGYGTIGKKIAMIAQTFDMRVVGVRSDVHPEDRASDPFTDEVVPVAELSEVLPQSDIVLDLLPLTPATENFFNSERFGSMKPGTLFVNLGRGATVVDAALIKAIDDGIVKYAALDVFRDEPLPDQHPFWTHPRILLTPHIGGLMPDYWGAVVDIFIENMKRFEQGSELLNVVDKEKGY